MARRRRSWFGRIQAAIGPRAKWAVIAFMWLTALPLGFFGYARYFADAGAPTTFWHTLHSTLELFKLSARNIQEPLRVNWALEAARFLAPGVMFYTLFQTLVLVFARQSELLRLRRARGHAVICGLGRKGMLLARDLVARGDLVVVIESDPANDLVGPCRNLGAVVLTGDARDPTTLRKARLPAARCLVAFTDNDGVNAEIAVRAEALARGREGEPLECYAHILDRELWRALRETQAHTGTTGAFQLEFFNVYDSGAQALLAAHPPFEAEEGCEPHVVLVGLGRLGRSLIPRAARLWTSHPHAPGVRLRVTVVDAEAEAGLAALKFRHPGLDRTCILIPRQLAVATPQFQRGEFLSDDYGVCTATIVYVCLPDDAEGLSAALIVHRRLRDLGHKIPIVVRLYEGGGLAQLLARLRDAGGEFASIHAFRLFDETCRAAHVLRGLGAPDGAAGS